MVSIKQINTVHRMPQGSILNKAADILTFQFNSRDIDSNHQCVADCESPNFKLPTQLDKSRQTTESFQPGQVSLHHLESRVQLIMGVTHPDPWLGPLYPLSASKYRPR